MDTISGSISDKAAITYTANGDMETVTGPTGVATKFFYNAFRKLTGIALDQTGKNLRASYDYDLNGNLTNITPSGACDRSTVVSTTQRYMIRACHIERQSGVSLGN